MQHRKGLLVGLLALGALATSSHGQSIQPLMHQGDTIIGMGALDGLLTLAINGTSMWVMEVDTDFTTSTEDGALLRNGFVTLREGLALFQPPGAFHNEFVDVNLAENGELGLLITLSDAGVARSGVFWNLVPVVVTGDPFPQHPTETDLVWNTLQHAKMNDNRDFLVFGELSLPGSALGKRHTLVRYHTDNHGLVTSVELLGTKGVEVPGLGGDTLSTLPTNLGATAMNSHGEFMWVVDGTTGLPAVLKGLDTVLAQEGAPSPSGEDWKYLARVPRVNLNDFGEYVFSGSTIDPADPTNDDAAIYMVVKNGEVFAKEGTNIGPFVTPMGKGSTHQIIITNGGDVFWYWQNLVGGSSSQFALMRNYVPIIEANVTRIGTNLVQSIPTQDSFHVSRDGRFYLTRVTVATLGETLLLMDFGSVVPIPGCSGNPGNPGKLRLVDGLALPGYALEGSGGASLVLGMDNGQAAGVRPVIYFSTRERIPGSPCGANTEWGELLISMGHRFGRVTLPTWDGTQESTIGLPIPNDLSLVDVEVFAQGAFVDINHTAAEDFRFTNALRIQIGAP
jgi:hypothetical protein